MGNGHNIINPAASNLHRVGSTVRPHDISIEQRYSSECTSVVWTNKRFAGAISHPGHAALLLRKNMKTDARKFNLFPQVVSYVSFLPSNADRNNQSLLPGSFSSDYLKDMSFETSEVTQERLQKREYSPKSNQLVAESRAIGDRYLERWGTAADSFVSMQAMGDADERIGIDLNRIVYWANNFRTSPQCAYVFFSTNQNCAGVAWQALDAGGGKAFCEYFTKTPQHRLYKTPNDFIEYVTYIQQGILAANRSLDYVRNTYKQKIQANFRNSAGDFFHKAGAGFNRVIASDLYSYEEWMRESSVSFRARGFILRDIDSAVKSFHTFDWIDNFSEKLLCLLKIIKGIEDHFLESSSGSRDAALVALAKQVNQIVSQLCGSSTKPWQEPLFMGENARTEDIHLNKKYPLEKVSRKAS